MATDRDVQFSLTVWKKFGDDESNDLYTITSEYGTSICIDAPIEQVNNRLNEYLEMATA